MHVSMFIGLLSSFSLIKLVVNEKGSPPKCKARCPKGPFDLSNFPVYRKGVWPCHVCSKGIEHKYGVLTVDKKAVCYFYNYDFMSMDDRTPEEKKKNPVKHCDPKLSWCKTPPGYTEENTEKRTCNLTRVGLDHCEDVVYTYYCCKCKNMYYGYNCGQLSPSTIDFRHAGGKVDEVFDLSNRPECWVRLCLYYYVWKNELLVSSVLAAIKERINDRPFMAVFEETESRVLFSKFPTRIEKKESENWCKTNTNLNEGCERFNLLFDPKHNGSEIKHIVHIQTPIFYALYEDASPLKYSSWELLVRENYTLGQLLLAEFRAFLVDFPSPYHRYKEYLNLQSSQVSLKTFINQTSIDDTCIPVLAQSCTAEYNKYVEFPYSPLEFKMQYTPPPDTCNENMVGRWSVFKEEKNAFHNPGDEVLVHEGCCTYSVPPYSLKLGQYFVQLTISHIIESNKLSNTRGCAVSILNDKIRASFKELVRQVNAEDLNKVEVDAFDINRPPKDQKKDLDYTWTCKINGTDEPCTDITNLLKNVPSFEIPRDRLKTGATYNFTVRVNSAQHVPNPLNDTSATVYQRLVVTTDGRYLITLRCATCDDNLHIYPQESNLILIKAKDGVSPPFVTDYEWTFAEETKGVIGEFRSVEQIQDVMGNGTTALKIMPDVLKYGTVYVFQATAKSTKVFSQIRVTTPVLKVESNCTVDPTEGVRGFTDFTVECTLHESGLTFEYYDKDENDESLFGGRMLGYNNVGFLGNFKMTKGKLLVLMFDSYKLKGNYTMTVVLEPYSDTLEYLEELLLRSREYTDSDNYDWPPATVSSVAEVTTLKMQPQIRTIKQPVLILHTVHFGYILGLVKLVLSSLQVVLTNTVSKFELLEEDAYLTKTAAETLLTVTLKLMHHEGNIAREFTLTKSIFYDMIKAVLTCVEILLEQKNREYLSRPEDYVKPYINDLVRSTSLMLVSVLDTVSYSLVRQQIVEDSAKKIMSDRDKLFASTKADYAEALSTWITSEKNCSVLISKELTSTIRNTASVLTLQYIRMRLNPFWWAGGNIVSEVLLANIYSKNESTEYNKLVRFNRFVTINLEVIESLRSVVHIEGTANQIDPNTTEENQELELTVYRIFLPEKAKLFLKFLINDTQEYRVLLKEGMRPEFTSIVEEFQMINATSPFYDVPYDNKHEDEKIYFMGILPSSKASIGESIPFRLKAYYSLCYTWVKWQWTSFGCWVGAETNEEAIHCDCNHLSVVAGAILAPDYSLSTVDEFILYLTPWENLLPSVIAVVIITLYLLLLFWAGIKDRKDRRREQVIVLEDNFPGDRFGYLLRVNTGSKLFSGTTAAVGVRLLGETDASRPHVLRSPDRSVLNAFSEDWFLIYSPRHLGKLRRLWLWHNDGGFCPDWFVEKIQIYDLKTRIKYMFELSTWIASEIDSYPDVYVATVQEDEYFSGMTLFRHKFIDSVRDTHNWTSVCLKHPRNPVSRAERLSVVVCFVLLGMAVCLILYLLHFGVFINKHQTFFILDNINEDKPSYFIDETDLFIFVIALIFTLFVISLIMGLFRKSFTNTYTRSKSLSAFKKSGPDFERPTLVRDQHSGRSATPEIDPSASVQQFQRLQVRMKPRRMRTTRETCLLAFQKIAQGNSLLPVRLPGTKGDLIVRKLWFLCAWVMCLATISISVLIILLFSWKLPTVKCTKFLTIFFGVVMFDAFILSFVKILIFSIILTCSFQNILPETEYHIKIKDGMRLNVFGDVLFLTKLLEARKQLIYYPLRESVKEYKRINKIRKFRWQKLVEFVMVVILVCVISAICNVYYINRFLSNTHAAQMMTTGEDIRIPDLSEVFNRTELAEFFETPYVLRLFRFIWYNYEPLVSPESDRRDWTSDCVTRLLGRTRIRQLRVSLEQCRASGYFRNTIHFCAPPWSEEAEEKDIYSTGWLLADYKETTRTSTTWRYTPADRSNSSRFYGQSGTLYHGGGYIADLGYFKKGTTGKLLTLEAEGWLDHMTRAVFAELTLYNVNTNLFTQVVLVSEQHPTGQYISIPKKESVSINIGFDFWSIGFIVFQIFFLVKALYLLNRNGLFVYLSSFLNSYDVFLLVLSFTTVAVYIVHVKYSSHYVENYRRQGLDEFFSFFEIIRYDFMSKATMCFLFTCVVVKVFQSWRFGQIYFNFYNTLLLSYGWIIWLTSFYILCIFILWRLVAYKMNIYLFSFYSAPILHPKDFKVTGIHESWGSHFVVYIMCLLSSSVILVFIASFAHFYRVAKFFKPFTYKKIDKFNYATFLRGECKRLVK